MKMFFFCVRIDLAMDDSEKLGDIHMLNITVVQPQYFSGDNPDEKIAEFLISKMESVPEGGLIVLPEYSNAGGLSDIESELAALPRAEFMLNKAAEI